MNPKIIGIILLVVGLGVGLYFINSGGAAKVSDILKPPTSSSSTIIGASSTASSTGTTIATTTAAATSTGFSWSNFFSSLFAPHTFTNLPGSAGSGGSQDYISSAPGGSGNSGNSGSGNSGSGSTTPPPTPPTGFTVAQLSPYYQQVRFSGISQGELSLTTYPAYGTPTSTVDVTGWEIKTNRGGEFLPQVQNIYEPTGVPVESDIVLALNQINYVNIYSNSAPANIRVNECMGYLNTPQQFNPGFSYDCPAVDTSQLSQFTGACQDYVQSLNGCQSPNFSSSYFPHNDYQCEQYLAGKYNYNWCVTTYATSPNFLGDEWRIWMGATPLDPDHDIVELLDKNGLLVNIYQY